MLSWLIAGLIFVYILLSLALYVARTGEPTTDDLNRKRHAAVVVLGDLGHSPRMSFHALSIAKHDWNVTLIGYKESALMDEVQTNPNIKVSELPVIRRSGPFVWYALKRVVLQHYQLWKALKECGAVDVVLVQNPPSIPTLGSTRFYSLFTRPGVKVIIDWHNFGHTILAMSVKNKLAVRVYRFYEFLFGRVASLHLTVSVRLGLVLKGAGIRAKRIMPLFDRPWKSYVIKSETEKNALKTTVFKELASSNPKAKWLVTSTSYTPDEDLDMLLDGLELYDKNAPKNAINLVVTGKGPLKEQFLKSVAQRKFANVEVHPAWLPYEQYQQLLAVSDLGVSLHKSSSGWDLPMKVVDMFGAGLPVIALNFPALEELVKPSNGLVFDSPQTLESSLKKCLEDPTLYKKIRSGAIAESERTWATEWDEKLGPVFMSEPPPLPEGYVPSSSSSSSDD